MCQNEYITTKPGIIYEPKTSRATPRKKSVAYTEHSDQLWVLLLPHQRSIISINTNGLNTLSCIKLTQFFFFFFTKHAHWDTMENLHEKYPVTYYLAASGDTGGAYTLDELLQLSSIMHKSRRHLDSVYFLFWFFRNKRQRGQNWSTGYSLKKKKKKCMSDAALSVFLSLSLITQSELQTSIILEGLVPLCCDWLDITSGWCNTPRTG